MSKIAIITDSASDVSPADEKEYGIFMMPFTAVLDDKEYVSRIDVDNDTFYKLMDASASLPTHSQLTAYDFIQMYKKLFADGYTDAIAVLINAEGSSTFENACMAYDLFLDEVPQAKDVFHVHPFDSESYSGSYGYAVVEAAKMVRQEKPLEEILAFIRDWLDHVAIYFGIYTLKYAKKSGRIPSAAAFVGEALGLKPILYIDDHKIVTADKVRGDKRVIPTIIDYVRKHMEPGSPYCLNFGSDRALLDEMRAAAEKAIGYPASYEFQVGAVIAANAGHRLIAITFRQKEQ